MRERSKNIAKKGKGECNRILVSSLWGYENNSKVTCGNFLIKLKLISDNSCEEIKYGGKYGEALKEKQWEEKKPQQDLKWNTTRELGVY